MIVRLGPDTLAPVHTLPDTNADNLRLGTDTPASVHTVSDTDADEHMLGHTRSLSQTVERVPCILTSRTEHFLKLLMTPSHENLAHVLLFPVVRKKQVSDGVQEVGPVNFSSTLQMLEDALTLVQRARREAGHHQESTCLGTEEFQKALDFLQKIFEDNFMENAQLKARIRNLQEKPEELSRKTKKKFALTDASHSEHGSGSSWATYTSFMQSCVMAFSKSVISKIWQVHSSRHTAASMNIMLTHAATRTIEPTAPTETLSALKQYMLASKLRKLESL